MAIGNHETIRGNYPVPAGVFGLVHGEVGAAQNAIYCIAVFPLSDAKAACHAKGFHFREIQRLNGLPQILGHLNCLGEVAGQKQTKLFAAKSADRALRYRFYRRAEFGQHNISGLVPMHVIDAFEPVHIK